MHKYKQCTILIQWPVRVEYLKLRLLREGVYCYLCFDIDIVCSQWTCCFVKYEDLFSPLSLQIKHYA